MKNVFKVVLISLLFVTGCTSSENKTTAKKPIELTTKHDELVVKFAKKQFQRNPNVELTSLEIKERKGVPSMEGWHAYVLDIALIFQGKEVKINDIMFTDGNVVTQNFFDLNTLRSIRETVMPDAQEKHYNEQHFLAGNPKGKNKVIVFSDPLCPFCKDYVPDLIAHIKAYTSDTALYYYHYPIETIHPQSVPIIKAIMVAQKQGVTEALDKAYEAEFTERGITAQESLDEFNKVVGTKITLDDISQPDIMEHYNFDLEVASDLMISGTPTVFVNGKRDNTKEMYKGLK
jgi:thiol:disulfide interchange protein DsbC